MTNKGPIGPIQLILHLHPIQPTIFIANYTSYKFFFKVLVEVI
jgi:hypothetical protein